MAEQRQKLLVLYLSNSSPDSGVVGWSEYDGTLKDGESPEASAEPPYRSVLEAMQDGWRVIQMPVLQPPHPGREYEVSYLKHEFVLEKLETVDG